MAAQRGIIQRDREAGTRIRGTETHRTLALGLGGALIGVLGLVIGMTQYGESALSVVGFIMLGAGLLMVITSWALTALRVEVLGR